MTYDIHTKEQERGLCLLGSEDGGRTILQEDAVSLGKCHKNSLFSLWWQATPVKRCPNLQDLTIMKDDIYCMKLFLRGKTQETILRIKTQPGMRANTCNPSTWEANQANLKGSGPYLRIQGNPSLCARTRYPLPWDTLESRIRISRVPHHFLLLWVCLWLCSPGWTQPHSHLPASAFLVLAVLVWAAHLVLVLFYCGMIMFPRI